MSDTKYYRAWDLIVFSFYFVCSVLLFQVFYLLFALDILLESSLQFVRDSSDAPENFVRVHTGHYV
jgi:hypothetical protein